MQLIRFLFVRKVGVSVECLIQFLNLVVWLILCINLMQKVCCLLLILLGRNMVCGKWYWLMFRFCLWQVGMFVQDCLVVILVVQIMCLWLNMQSGWIWLLCYWLRFFVGLLRLVVMCLLVNWMDVLLLFLKGMQVSLLLICLLSSRFRVWLMFFDWLLLKCMFVVFFFRLVRNVVVFVYGVVWQV